VPQPGALPRRALLRSFYIGGGINFMAKQRFLGSLDAHHVLPLPRVHGHDQQRRRMLFIYELQRMEPTPWEKKKKSLPGLEVAFSFGFISAEAPSRPRSLHPHPFPVCFPFFPPFFSDSQAGKCRSFISFHLFLQRKTPLPSSLLVFQC